MPFEITTGQYAVGTFEKNAVTPQRFFDVPSLVKLPMISPL